MKLVVPAAARAILDIRDNLLRIVDRQRRVAVDRNLREISFKLKLVLTHVVRIRADVGDADGAVGGGARRIQRHTEKTDVLNWFGFCAVPMRPWNTLGRPQP